MKEDVYRELVRRSAHDVDYASYVLLLEACTKTLEAFPETIEQFDSLDKKDVLSETVARLMEALSRVIPYPELVYYLPKAEQLPWPLII